MSEDRVFREPHIHFAESAVHRGKRIRAFGRNVFCRPLDETFDQFLLYFLRGELGPNWWETQRALHPYKKHVLMKWFETAYAWQRKHQTEEFQIADGLWSVPMSGYAKALVQCAYDLLVLHHCGLLSASLLHRLRNAREFQGARYEAAVAAIFVRCGYSVRFVEEVHGQKICEFHATHPSGVKVAVEAKSRRRPGTLNEKGERTSDAMLGLKRLYAAARKKKPMMPFVIFLDANFPPMPGVPWKDQPGFLEIKRMFGNYPEATPETPDLHNALTITNYAYYYQEDDVMQHHPPLSVWSLHPKYPVPDGPLWHSLIGGIDKYTCIPREV